MNITDRPTIRPWDGDPTPAEEASYMGIVPSAFSCEDCYRVAVETLGIEAVCLWHSSASGDVTPTC